MAGAIVAATTVAAIVAATTVGHGAVTVMAGVLAALPWESEWALWQQPHTTTTHITPVIPTPAIQLSRSLPKLSTYSKAYPHNPLPNQRPKLRMHHRPQRGDQ